MKIKVQKQNGYALIMVVVMSAIAALMLSSTMNRTFTNAKLNDRSNAYTTALNAAEAATEKVVTRMRYDFQSYGMPMVAANLDLYRSYVPNEDPYWSNFVFSDAKGNVNRTYVGFVSNYVGNLPSQYPGLSVSAQSLSPIYRIISNVKTANGVTAAVQEDVLLALVPINQYAIFYNGLLEFSTAAPMTVNGRVHANGSIYTGSSCSLTLNGTVTCTGTISSPANNGQGPWTPNNVTFNGSPGSRTNVPTVTLSIGTTNVHNMIDIPVTNETPSAARMYYQAQTILLISNNAITFRIQAAPSTNDYPATDPNSITLTNTWTMTNSGTSLALSNQFPFLTTNSFYDLRESKTILTSQIDVGKYAQWIKTNSSVLSKFSQSASGNYPTILYVADNRTASASQLTAVRLVNGTAPPANGGLGFSVATPNPLYVRGNYNCTNASYLGTTNTQATVPCALMSDALTILSPSWNDPDGTNTVSSKRPATSTTINAAILTGVVPSTGTSSSTFSGGVHNLTRLLEDWSNQTLTLNTSIMNLFNSTRATHAFVNPSTYYVPPTRQFSFDQNFLDPKKQPPGIPTALVLIRMNWGTPPPNSTTYNVTP